MSHQHGTLNDTVYFWFASNDTSGSGGDGATALADVRLAGATASDIPILSPTPALLTHANYPAGCYEVAVAATSGNGFAADNTYGVFCTLAIDSQNPSGFIGSMSLFPVVSDMQEIGGDSQSQIDIKDFADAGYDPGTNKVQGVLLTDTATTLTNKTDFSLSTAGILAIWHQLTAAIVTASTIGKLLVDNVNATISSRMAEASINTTTGAIDNVTLVATTTENTDMRGTENAALASVCTETRLSELDAATPGKVAHQIDIIQTDTTTDIPATITTAQNDLDTLTGSDGATLATAQGNYAPSKAGDAMTLTAAATSAQLVDDVWDEALTGATHDVATSAGRRIRALQEFQGYDGGAIWIDTINGNNPVTPTDYEDGTVENPVDNIADANTLALSLGISRFRVAPGSSITLAATQANQEFIGTEWTLALGGQNIAGTKFEGATITGIGTGASYHLTHCSIGNVTLANGSMGWCQFTGTITASAASDYFTHDCYSGVAGSGTPVFDYGAAVGNTNLNLRRYSGGIQIDNKDGTGTDLMSLEGNGQLIVSASSSGAISMRGNFKVTNTGGATITTDDNTSNTAAIVLDTTIPTKNAAFSNLPVFMVGSTDHVTPKTGLTLGITRSLDGGAFGAGTGSAAEIGNGMYQYDASQADMNADVVIFRFTGTDADDTFITIITKP